MKIREQDYKIIEQMVISEDGAFASDQDGHIKSFISKRQGLLNRLNTYHKDKRKEWDTKRSWRLYRRDYEKGIKQFHSSTKGKAFHRKLNRYLADRQSAYGTNDYSEASVQEKISREDLLTTLFSLQTSLIIESNYFIPDFDTHLSTKIMVENAMDILFDLTKKITRNEQLTFDEKFFLAELCV
jgi:hypothetical protein